MGYFNEDLKVLKEQTIQKKKAETELTDLRSQQQTLAQKLKELEKIKVKEEKDVERLERGSLAAAFFEMIGKKEERLSKEEQEARLAAVKYDTAREELAMVEREISLREGKLRELSGCEERYEKALQQKLYMVRAESSAESAALLSLEETMYQIEAEMREIQEAVAAGKKALSTVEDALDSLDSADSWATWDTFGGGGLLTDIIKHDHLDEAQAKINTLQMELRAFKTELADVKVHADIQVQIEECLKFADFFFDGLFANWAVMDEIEESIGTVKNTRNEIVSVLNKLEDKLVNARQRYQRKVEERERMMLG